jgi:hypothetical protein
MQLPA